MNNEIKEDYLIFGDAMLLPNEDENWKFILADRTYTLDAPTEVIISRMLKQLLAEQAKNKKMVEALEKISNGNRMTYCRSREALLFGCANKDALNINCQSCDYFIAQQALNEVNNAK